MGRIEVGRWAGVIGSDGGINYQPVDFSQTATFSVTARLVIKRDGVELLNSELTQSEKYAIYGLYLTYDGNSSIALMIVPYFTLDASGTPVAGSFKPNGICFSLGVPTDSGYSGANAEIVFFDEEIAQPIKLQEKSVAIADDTVILPDDGYDGMSSVAITLENGKTPEAFSIDSYTPDDFPYKSAFTIDWTSAIALSCFDNAKDFVETYFYGVLYDLIPRINVPENIVIRKQKLFLANALAWYMTDFFGTTMGATAPTTGLLPISQKNIGGVFIGFAKTESQQAIKALESNQFGVMCLNLFYSCKERYALYQ